MVCGTLMMKSMCLIKKPYNKCLCATYVRAMLKYFDLSVQVVLLLSCLSVSWVPGQFCHSRLYEAVFIQYNFKLFIEAGQLEKLVYVLVVFRAGQV